MGSGNSLTAEFEDSIRRASMGTARQPARDFFLLYWSPIAAGQTSSKLRSA